MPRTRKSHPPSLKAKVAVEAVSAQDGRPDRSDGRRPPYPGRRLEEKALADLPDIFGNGREQMRQQADTEKDEL